VSRKRHINDKKQPLDLKRLRSDCRVLLLQVNAILMTEATAALLVQLRKTSSKT
jgi:hypothetical protein